MGVENRSPTLFSHKQKAAHIKQLQKHALLDRADDKIQPDIIQSYIQVQRFRQVKRVLGSIEHGTGILCSCSKQTSSLPAAHYSYTCTARNNHTDNLMDGCASLEMYMYIRQLTTPTLQIRRQVRKRVYFGTREHQIQVDACQSSDLFTSYLIGGKKKASETHTIAMLINTIIALKPIYLYTCIYLYLIIQSSFHTGPCQCYTRILSLPCLTHVANISTYTTALESSAA